jgi:hypothetical protein
LLPKLFCQTVNLRRKSLNGRFEFFKRDVKVSKNESHVVDGNIRESEIRLLIGHGAESITVAARGILNGKQPG